jgi:hypothetical protein
MRSHDADMWQVILSPSSVFMSTNRSRCAKRSKPDQCVYHPAPLTKASSTQGTPDAGTPRLNSFSTLHLSPSDRDVTNDSFYPYSKRVKLTGELQPAYLSRDVSPTQYTQQDPQGFEELRESLLNNSSQIDVVSLEDSAGFISHSAILAENELSVGIPPPNTDVSSTIRVSQSHVDRGAAILTLLNDLSTLQKYIDK